MLQRNKSDKTCGVKKKIWQWRNVPQNRSSAEEDDNAENDEDNTV